MMAAWLGRVVWVRVSGNIPEEKGSVPTALLSPEVDAFTHCPEVTKTLVSHQMSLVL